MNQNKSKIRTRFAPSPTGELHIGSARTALFAYLFAKHNQGEFLLRIEDTDRERYVEGAIERIIESLNWLGIKPDNQKPMIQSERLEIYKKHAFELVNKGKAYICTCSKERLEKLREDRAKNKVPTGYDGKCRNIKNKIENIKDLENALSDGAVIRLKMPTEGKIVVNDLIRGKVEFDAKLLDDTIILKSDGYPTYHLASVVDDSEMQISHVIRAEEWLSSTPKHLVLYEAFGWKAPEFAHLPMILGPDKKKLSKRHGATSVLEYKKLGYLPEAITNFIALLGWNPKFDFEILTITDLIRMFKIKGVNKSPAIFDIEKLKWMNEQYEMKIPPKDMQEGLINLAKINKELAENISKLFGKKIEELNKEIENAFSMPNIHLIQRGGYKTLKEAADYILKLRQEPEYEAELLVFKKSDSERTNKGLEEALKALEGLEETSDKKQDTNNWESNNIQKVLSKVVEANNLSNGDVFWPVRVALSGEEKSPSPVELAVALGKEESIKRIQIATEMLK